MKEKKKEKKALYPSLCHKKKKREFVLSLLLLCNMLASCAPLQLEHIYGFLLCAPILGVDGGKRQIERETIIC